MPSYRRYRSPVRRRRLMALAAVLAVGAGVGACSTLAKGGGNHGDSSTSPSPSNATTTSDRPPGKPSSYNVGSHRFYWVDHSRDTPDPATGGETAGRVLTTDVRYPTVRGSSGHETTNAGPATGDGPFPVIVFAHGFDVDPSIYAPLLDSWVRAGFVVVSPIFPDENAQRIAQLGGPNSTEGQEAENEDIVNEPGDVAFVLKQFALVDAAGSGSFLSGIGDLSQVALAGQSDGANVVAALAFGTAYRSTWSSITPAPKAVVVLSGEALSEGPGDVANGWSSGPASPKVLQVQSDADTCNSAQDAADLFEEFGGAPVHLFELLHGASHLQPYTDAVPGPNPYAPVVERSTVAFLRFALGVGPKEVSLGSVEAAATSSVSKVFTASDAIGPAIQGSPGQSPSGCEIP